MGQLESGGLSFDHLWVMGLSENVLPAAARPNPFLPFELQQGCGMPHASAERELQFAEQVVERLKFSSPRVVFSYPQQEGDCELRPSPLLPKATTLEKNAFAEPQDALFKLSNLQAVLPELQDELGPSLPGGRGQGGTSILKDQAHCPFRAFVHHRLQGRQQEQASPGLDAMTRGDLVHQVLEHLWRKLIDQQALLELTETDQAQLLEEVIEASVESYFTKRTPVSAQLLTLEKQRLALLVGDWLNSVERQRDPFRVLEMEREHVEKLGPLELTTKIDRIDELPDGSRVVLDYKTGRNLKAEDLLTEPLLEPQLPIYAVADDGAEADAVAFAQVQRNECRLLGVVREKGLLGRVKALSAYPQAEERNLDSWEALLSDWRRQLEGLAADFVAGRAEVKPYDRQRSCQYCDLPGLCRINEAGTSKGDVS
jgi:probable DNA repair protein